MARLVSATLLTLAALALILSAGPDADQQAEAQSAQPSSSDAIVLVAD